MFALSCSFSFAFAGAPSLTVDGSTLTQTTASGTHSVDVAPFVHVQRRGVEDVALQLLDSDSTATGDRVVTAWIVRGETADEPWLSFWIGVTEPNRGSVAGFPLSELPSDLSLSADGHTVRWSSAGHAYSLRLEPAPAPKSWASRPPPIPTAHLVSEPLPTKVASR